MIYFIYALLCLIWGSTWVAIKIGLDDTPPFWAAALRFLIAGLVVLVINKYRRLSYPRDWTTIWKIGLPGLFMYGISYLSVYWAEVYIDSALAGVLFAGFPFFVAGFSMLIIKSEKLKLVGWLGLLIGFVGIVVVYYDSLSKSAFEMTGVSLVVFGSAAASFGTVYIRAYLREVDIFIMAAIQILFGLVVMMAAAIIFEPITDFKITYKSISALMYLAVPGTVVTFLGYYWLLKKMKVISVSQIAFITPIIAVILGHFLRNEMLSSFGFLGASMIIVGVFLVVRR